MTRRLLLTFCGLGLLALGACSSSGAEPAELTEQAAAPTPAPTPTATPDPTVTPTPPPTATPAPTPTPLPTATATPAPTPTPTPTFDVPSEPLFELQGEAPLTTEQINETILFVQAKTGREFTYPPTITVKTTEQFIAGLQPGAETDAEAARYDEQARLLARRLQALGFSTLPETQLVQALNSSTSQLAGAYYDPAEDIVVMPAEVFPDFQFARILVHELVHALDWQFDAGLQLEEEQELAFETGNYERLNVRSFIIEGRASVVDDAWRWPEGWGDQGSFDDVEGIPPAVAAAQDPDTVPLPDVLIQEFSARYRFGPTYIRAQGGVSETWDLLDNPPPSTEELIVPASAGQAIVTVDVPVADGPILETRVTGALDMALVLTGRGTINSVARGWAGGRSVMWGDDTQTCVRHAIATDEESDQTRLFTTFGRWVDQGDDRTVVIEDDLIVATSCAPYIP